MTLYPAKISWETLAPDRWYCDGCDMDYDEDDECYNENGEPDHGGKWRYCTECNINRQAAKREAAEEGER